MALQCGIVGLPNVGKSTLFNCLTRAKVAAENYPFCTIEPNVGVVAVPDPRLKALADIVRPEKILPATVEFVDIAGLVAGASQGDGLGNQFLSHIRETDAIAQVVRCFINDDIVHVSGKVSPLNDIGIINTELALADLDSVEKMLMKQQKNARAGDKQALTLVSMLEKIKILLAQGKPARLVQLTKEEIPLARSLQLLTFKPLLYVANVSENGFQNNSLLEQVEQLAREEGAIVVPISAALESEISQLDDEEKELFLKDLNLKEAGLDRLIHATYHLLGLETYFTAGVKEVRAWTIPKQCTAPQAAGVIHTDFAKGFIRAEVISYEDFIQYKGETGAKEHGKWRLEGKDYIVKDGDVMHFRFNV